MHLFYADIQGKLLLIITIIIPSRSASSSSPVVLLAWCLQSLGAADANDKDGETVAGLVNKAALDTIAKVWACTNTCLLDVLSFYTAVLS